MTTSSNSNGDYTAFAGRARHATKKSAETLKRGAKTLTDQANVVAALPTIDLTQPVQRYFEYLQKAVDFNRDLATQWAELVTSWSGSVREQSLQLSSIVTDQAEKVADLTTRQAEKAEELAKEQATKVEQAEQEQAREAKRVERAQAKQAREQAREPYEELTKAELADQLSERGLPKTGNVDELIERLVNADNE